MSREGENILRLLNAWLSAEENPVEYDRVIRPVMEQVERELLEDDPSRLLQQERLDHLFCSLLYSPVPAMRSSAFFERFAGFSQELGLGISGQRYICITTMIGLDGDKGPSYEQGALRPFLRAAGEQVLREQFKVCGLNGGERILFLLSFGDTRDEEEAVRQAIDLCRECQRLMQRWLDAQVSFLISRVVENLSGLYAAYEQTRAEHVYLCATGGVPAVLTYGEMLQAAGDSRVMNHETYLQLSDMLYGRLRECFHSQRFSSAMDIVGEIIRTDLAHTRGPIMQEVRARKLVCFVLDNMSLLPQAMKDKTWREMTRSLLWVDTLAGSEKKFQAVFDMLIERFSGQPDGQRTLIDSVRLYIDEHFADPDLSVAGIADQFHISQGYLGAVLKAGGESSLLEIIQCRRVDEAKMLLRDTALSVSRVAARVGYAYNAGNLTRVFKRRLGITPQEYRVSFSVVRPTSQNVSAT